MTAAVVAAAGRQVARRRRLATRLIRLPSVFPSGGLAPDSRSPATRYQVP
jgi:hypothetical protein